MSVIEKLDPILKLMDELVTANTAYECDMISRAITQQMCAIAAQGHGPAIRQSMIDARRYRELRDAFLWTLTSGSDGTRLSVYMPGVFLDAIGPDDDEFDAALDAAIDARLASDSEGGSDE